jgi:iron complex outermembrane receptor protein
MNANDTGAPALRRERATALAIAAVLAAGAAQAQQAPTDSAQLDEITITATKREESLQDVPVAVSVVSGAALEQGNLNSLEAIQSRIPTLNFRANASNKDTSLFIRGVGTISTSPGIEPTVSTVVDGVVYSRAGMATLDLMDVERLEVLRGPQGTLFGKNASAGVINIVSRPIASETRGSIDLSWYEGDEKRVRAGLSGSLSDSARASINVSYGEFPGIIRNTFLGEDVGGYDRQGGRVKFEIDATENVSIKLIGDYAKADDTGSRGPVIRATGTGAAGPLAASIAPIVPSFENRLVATNVKERVEDTNYGLSAQIDWRVAGGEVTSITAARKWKNTQFQDLDATNQVYNEIAANADRGQVDSKQFSQELRFASEKGGFFDYVAGLFYYKSETDEVYRRDVIRCNGTLPMLPNGLTPCAAQLLDNGVATYGTELESWSVFGEATLNFTERLRGVVGLRYTDDDLSFYHSRTSTAGAVDIPGVRAARPLNTGSTTDNGISGRIGPQFDVTENVMAYATYSRGYKGPAYGAFFNMRDFDNAPVAAEEADSFELGLKSTLFGNRLRLNVAVFDTEYSGYQANIADIVSGVTVTRLISAGDVSTKGVEADFEAKVTPDFGLSGAIAYTKARIDQFRCPPGNTGCLSLNGAPLPFAPDWKASLGANYGVDIGTRRLEFGVDWTYQDDTQYALSVSPLTIGPSYNVFNASVALSDEEAGWRVALVGKNLGDESYMTNILDSGLQRGVPRDDERYFGIQARFNFGAR